MVGLKFDHLDIHQTYNVIFYILSILFGDGGEGKGDIIATPHRDMKNERLVTSLRYVVTRALLLIEVTNQ